jgi:mono/diheme cytochrome c family protein
MAEVIMNKPYLALGLFDTSQQLVDAIRKLRGEYGQKLEAYTPFPIHGIEKELGIPKSHLGKIVLGLGLTGLALAFGFQSWVFTTDYQIQFGGKPYFSWASFIPIVFEVTVLMASIVGAVFGMLAVLNKLPHYSHPILSSKSMPAITRDRFCLAISVSSDEEAQAAITALAAAGAASTEDLRGDDEIGVGELLPVKHVLATVLICVLAGVGTWQLMRLWNKIPLIAVMDEQQKVLPYRATGQYADGQSMLKPVAGTVARGHRPEAWSTPEEAAALLVNPLPATEEVLDHGRWLYETNCLVCHGALGDGQKLLSDRYMAAPANLHTTLLKEAADGHFYAIITNGKNTMAGYGKDIKPLDRWAIVHYVRALQSALDATDAEVTAARNLPAVEVKTSHEGGQH